LTVDDVQEKAQYHSACNTNYLLKWKKEHSADNYSTIKNESEHDIAFNISGTSTKEASTSENLRSAFNLLAARIASATDIELLKTIFD
jgi:hypothetical protein